MSEIIVSRKICMQTLYIFIFLIGLFKMYVAQT